MFKLVMIEPLWWVPRPVPNWVKGTDGWSTLLQSTTATLQDLVLHVDDVA